MNFHKVVLIGESDVGKIEIISQFLNQTSNTETLNQKFFRKNLELKNGNFVTLDIYDTIGDVKDRFESKIFYKDAKAIIFVYDCTDEKSFKKLKEYWYEDMKQRTNKDVIFVVAGNKSELYENKKVSNEEGEEWAKSIGAVFFSISSKYGSGIDEMFNYIGEKINNPKYDFYAEKEKGKEENKKRQEKENDGNEKLVKENNKKVCVLFIKIMFI